MNKIRVLFLLVMTSSLCVSQTIDQFLDSYQGENAIPYLQPLADLFTANLNTGIREWSKIDTSIYIRISMVAMASFPAKSQKTFTGKTDSDFEPEQTTAVPTIIGAVQPVTVPGVNTTAYVFPGGYNLKALPMAAPQLTIGGIHHTEITGRYFAFQLEHNLGKVSLFGLGIRHGLNSYLPSIPFEFSVGYFYNQFKDSTYINSQVHLGSVYLGKSGTWWSTQLMLGYQSSRTQIQYSFTQNEEVKHINLTLNNKYSFIAELSAALKIWILNLHGSISYSGPVTAAAGLGFQF